MRGRLGGAIVALTVVLVLGVVPAQAAFVYSASGPGQGGATLSAQAEFSTTGCSISFNCLQIKLSNTALNDEDGTQDVPGNTLTGVFFNISGYPSLTLVPLMATITAGSLIQGNKCSDGPCDATTTSVGGEFRYATNVSPDYPRHGIASSGYIGGSGNFQIGSNLDDPKAVDGINFGIISGNPSNTYNPNGGLQNEPLIKGSVTFLLLGLPGAIDNSNIGSYILNVVFQYGTGWSEPCVGCRRVASPAALVLLGSGLAALLGPRWFRRRRARKA